MLTGYAVFADRPSGDKDTRMLPFIAQAEAGNVRLVAGAWNADYIEELVQPAQRHLSRPGRRHQRRAQPAARVLGDGAGRHDGGG